MNNPVFKKIEQNWRLSLEAISKISEATTNLTIAPPSTDDEIKLIENSLGYSLPAPFRTTLNTFSASVDFSWSLPENFERPPSLKDVFRGECKWSLNELVRINNEKDSWIKEVFPNPEDPYDRIWHNKFAFSEISNGDFLAINLETENAEPIIYLSHDDGEGHGFILADNFEDFLLKWSYVLCVGPEDWQWLPFTSYPNHRLNPHCNNAREFRNLINLQLTALQTDK